MTELFTVEKNVLTANGEQTMWAITTKQGEFIRIPELAFNLRMDEKKLRILLALNGAQNIMGQLFYETEEKCNAAITALKVKLEMSPSSSTSSSSTSSSSTSNRIEVTIEVSNSNMNGFLENFGLDEETDVTDTTDGEVSEMLFETLSDDFGVDLNTWYGFTLDVEETEEGYTINVIGFA